MSIQRKHPMHREKYGAKKLELPPLAAFDFETDGLGGDFIVCAVWTSDDTRLLFDSLDNFFQWMLDHPEYRYLAHNAVGYEFAYMAPLFYGWFADHDNVDIRPTIQGDNRVVQFTLTITDTKERRGRAARKSAKTIIDIRDTLCLFNMPLAKVAEAFCPEIPKMKEAIDFEKETWDITNPEHVAYVYRDCEIVLKAYQRHAANIQNVFGSPLGVTAGSTAIKAYKTTIPAGHVYYRTNADVEKFIRKAYYGALVLPGHQLGDWGKVGCVDINGAYAYQMATHKYPVGSAVATHRMHPTWLGFYRVLATVPASVFDTYGFNPIPCKEPGGLSWPTGTFETYISTPEIRYAEHLGCTIQVLGGYYFPREEDMFSEFIEKCQEMELANDGLYKPSIKQIRNSAYGKFGSKEIHKSLVFSHETLVGLEPVRRADTGERIEGLYVGEEISDADYMLPHIAAMITAYERLYVMQTIEEAYRRGAKNVYCDTDSIKCDLSVMSDMLDTGSIPVGDTYGKYKIEEICDHFLVLGPKCFYGDVSNRSDKPLIKTKGIPSREIKKAGRRVFEDALVNERREVPFTSVKSVMNIIKEKSHVQPIHRKRKITDLRNSFAWQVTKEGKIYPKGYPLEPGRLAELDRKTAGISPKVNGGKISRMERTG